VTNQRNQKAGPPLPRSWHCACAQASSVHLAGSGSASFLFIIHFLIRFLSTPQFTDVPSAILSKVKCHFNNSIHCWLTGFSN